MATSPMVLIKHYTVWEVGIHWKIYH